ncbi:MAG: hypothetical protein Q4F79_13720 [Eubacteriales bacterium]|nr:hypothetical protein [Eubacteriales bacterium]
MNELEQKRLADIQQGLMELHDRLVDLTGTGKKKRRTEQEALLTDALDSLEEAISCIEEALDE